MRATEGEGDNEQQDRSSPLKTPQVIGDVENTIETLAAAHTEVLRRILAAETGSASANTEALVGGSFAAGIGMKLHIDVRTYENEEIPVGDVRSLHFPPEKQVELLLLWMPRNGEPW